MNVDADDLVVDRPVVSTVLVAAVATVVYVVIQLIMDGTINGPETVSFVVVFTLVYVGGSWYLRRRDGDRDDDEETREDATERSD